MKNSLVQYEISTIYLDKSDKKDRYIAHCKEHCQKIAINGIKHDFKIIKEGINSKKIELELYILSPEQMLELLMNEDNRQLIFALTKNVEERRKLKSI